MPQREGLRAQVQGRVQEALLLDAGMQENGPLCFHLEGLGELSSHLCEGLMVSTRALRMESPAGTQLQVPGPGS